jgi:hypothetical protein
VIQNLSWGCIWAIGGQLSKQVAGSLAVECVGPVTNRLRVWIPSREGWKMCRSANQLNLQHLLPGQFKAPLRTSMIQRGWVKCIRLYNWQAVCICVFLGRNIPGTTQLYNRLGHHRGDWGDLYGIPVFTGRVHVQVRLWHLVDLNSTRNGDVLSLFL